VKLISAQSYNFLLRTSIIKNIVAVPEIGSINHKFRHAGPIAEQNLQPSVGFKSGNPLYVAPRLSTPDTSRYISGERDDAHGHLTYCRTSIHLLEPPFRLSVLTGTGSRQLHSLYSIERPVAALDESSP